MNKMGIFNLLKSKNTFPQAKDMVWKSKQGKFNGCLELLQQHSDAIFTCWFKETLLDFNQFLSSNNKSPLELKLAGSLFPSTNMIRTIIFLEHYPLRAAEDNFLNSFNPTEVFFLNSLDEPLFQNFGGERIIGLMDTLGLNEEDFIEHSMISKSIRRAQDKIQKKIRIEYSANSAGEWFQINVK